MKRQLFLCLSGFLFLLFAVAFSARATHIVGGELTYQCIGVKQYQFTLVIYSECGSEAILEPTYPIRYFSPSQGLTFAQAKFFNVSKTEEVEVPIYCSAETTDCTVEGGLRGIKKVIYKGRVDLGVYELAPDWTFYWVRSARSEAINTLLAPDNQDYYIQVEMNNEAAPYNNSPIFTENPVISACIGEEKSYNNVAYDIDGDELRYFLTTPKSSYNDEVVYLDDNNDGKPDYDGSTFVPMAKAAQLDSLTGDLSFTPNMLMVGITDVRVDEYRNGVRISSVTRGLQITSVDCENNIPELSTFKENKKFIFRICAGDTLDLHISGTDAVDETDLLTMKLLSGKSDIFKTKNNVSTNPEGEFHWITSVADTGKYYFTVQLEDNACPKPEIGVKTYMVEVLPLPKFDLGLNQILSCHDVVPLEPQVTSGDGKYAYAWSTGESNSSIEAAIGMYSLTVTDGRGCSATDYIVFDGDLMASFMEENKCFGETTVFTDMSTSANSNIVSWLWDFGDGTTSTEPNPEHQFLTAGMYMVELTVKNNDTPACSNTTSKQIVVCPPLELDFVSKDSCSLTGIEFEIEHNASNFSCAPTKVTWDFGDGNVVYDTLSKLYIPEKITHVYETAGTYTVTLKSESDAGCITEVSKEINIYDTPIINIIEDNFNLDCNEPDSVLHTEILGGGNGMLSYSWIQNFFLTSETSENLAVNANGYYTAIVTDELGCHSLDTMQIYYPLQAWFNYEAYCKEGDPIWFKDVSVANAEPIVSWEWDFGDGGSSTIQNPTHLYTEHGVYNATLKVTDGSGCTSEVTQKVYIKLLQEDEFDLQPREVSICVNDYVYGTGPSIELGGLPPVYSWDMGDGREPIPDKDIQTGYNNPDEDVQVVLTTIFNTVPGATLGCLQQFTETLIVYPELDVAIEENRICRDLPVDFSFKRIAGDLGIPITTAAWNFGDETNIDYEFSPTHVYGSTGRYNIVLNVKDQNGCRKTVTKTAQVERVAKPDFLFDIVCAGGPTSFTINFKDSLENITDFFWDFGNSDTLSGLWPATDRKFKFEQGGTYPVTLTVSNINSKCDQSVTKQVDVIHIPVAKFIADTVCFGDSTTFTNLSTMEDGTITGYEWLFSDGITSTEKDPVLIMHKAGSLPVQLVVHNNMGCSDTLVKNIVVKPLPVADYYTDVEYMEAYEPIQFFDDSDGAESYFWDFGNGDTSTEKNPIYTYDAVAIYEVTHIVTNAGGCTDTISKPANLNVYLELPTAFSPNNDGKNDALGLIHRNIKELYDFKIYNRWGEKVFDAGNQLDHAWDGTLKGKLQGSGVYIVHVKAKGAYDINFNFKKNITLLR